MLQMSPGNEDLIGSKAFFLQGEGRLDESARELNNAPADSKDDSIVIARILQGYYERKFDTAISMIQTSTSPVVRDPRTLTLLGSCQLFAGRKSDAQATFLRAISVIKPSPDSAAPVDARMLPSYLAMAYAGLGEKEKALEQARSAVAAYKNDILSAAQTESILAQVEAQVGDEDAAIAALPRLLQETNGLSRGQLRVDPIWDPLRNDPRFQKLVAEPAETK
jgi:tetratricopeptide (TPR) repeat protein